MPRVFQRHEIRVLTCCVCVLATTASLSAAQSGALRGVVVDSANGSPLGNANVLITTLHRVAHTDADGRFELDEIPKGEIRVVFRRLGYKAQRMSIVLSGKGRDSLKIPLVADREAMNSIAGDETERQIRQGIEDFYVRRATGNGFFIASAQLDKLNGSRWTDALRLDPDVLLRNGVQFVGNARDCRPVMLLNDRPGGWYLNDAPIRPEDVEGIELYHGAVRTPRELLTTEALRTNSELRAAARCGLIVVWSRRSGMRKESGKDGKASSPA